MEVCDSLLNYKLRIDLSTLNYFTDLFLELRIDGGPKRLVATSRHIIHAEQPPQDSMMI